MLEGHKRPLRRWTWDLWDLLKISQPWTPSHEYQSKNKQSNEPPPEFTAERVQELSQESDTLASVHTYYIATIRAHVRVLSRFTGPAWDACDGLTPEDMDTESGVDVVLETLANAFQGEHETEHLLEDTFYGPGRKKGEKLRVHNNV